MGPARSMRLERLALVSLCVAVAAAFADSSIVVLALPQLLRRFGTGVEGISWVITSYNVAVAVAALALVRLATAERARRLLAGGVAVFLLGSAGCAASNGLAELIAFRCVQGVGGALLLVAALPRLAELSGSHRRGIELWALSGAIGAALGPALGGALTEAFSWRSIFVLQLPLALAATAALAGPRAVTVEREHMTHPRERVASGASLGLVSGALVGALFLAVLLLIDGWRLSPLRAAGIVSAIPLATLAVRRPAAALPRTEAAAIGALVLAGGLTALALLPSASVLLATLALALCGLGIGLAVPPLTASTLDPDALDASGALTIGIRHAGLVLALVALTPVLAHDLRHVRAHAIAGGTAVVLDANLGITTKLPLALDLDRTLDRPTAEARVPDLGPVFARHESSGNRDALDHVRRQLTDVIHAVVTRSTRRAFALSALLAAAALLPLAFLRRREPA